MGKKKVSLFIFLKWVIIKWQQEISFLILVISEIFWEIFVGENIVLEFILQLVCLLRYFVDFFIRMLFEMFICSISFFYYVGCRFLDVRFCCVIIQVFLDFDSYEMSWKVFFQWKQFGQLYFRLNLLSRNFFFLVVCLVVYSVFCVYLGFL